jgi:hypothetical protein
MPSVKEEPFRGSIETVRFGLPGGGLAGWGAHALLRVRCRRGYPEEIANGRIAGTRCGSGRVAGREASWLIAPPRSAGWHVWLSPADVLAPYPKGQDPCTGRTRRAQCGLRLTTSTPSACVLSRLDHSHPQKPARRRAIPHRGADAP